MCFVLIDFQHRERLFTQISYGKLWRCEMSVLLGFYKYNSKSYKLTSSQSDGRGMEEFVIQSFIFFLNFWKIYFVQCLQWHLWVLCEIVNYVENIPTFSTLRLKHSVGSSACLLTKRRWSRDDFIKLSDRIWLQIMERGTGDVTFVSPKYKEKTCSNFLLHFA